MKLPSSPTPRQIQTGGSSGNGRCWDGLGLAEGAGRVGRWGLGLAEGAISRPKFEFKSRNFENLGLNSSGCQSNWTISREIVGRDMTVFTATCLIDFVNVGVK
jgi:hypothetical protein